MAFQHQVFISFSEEDTERVRPLVEALRRCGWHVWWYKDESLKLGGDVQRDVQKALEEARAAVVVWSKHSFGSGWVKSEAYRARERGTFIPIRIDEGEIPLPFNLDRTADLCRWDGTLDYPDFRALITRVKDLAGSSERLQQRMDGTSGEAVEDDDSHALAPGTKVGEYTIVSVLGQGGFGITYLAEHGAIRQRVALKEFLPTSVARRSANRLSVKPLSTQVRDNFEWGVNNFREEARTLVRLRHPNIVRVLNFFEFNGTAYLVMEYEEGRSLARLIETEPLESDQILEILPAILSGLDEVHAAGIQHRDIKPANIYLRRADATPVLIDFGSARQAIAQRTRTTSMVRSDGYSPYEQYISAGAIGPWTDIYALGATLYHCMVGQPPPPAPDRVAAQRKKAPDPVAELPTRLGGRYDERLCAAVVAALSLDESDRPQSVDEFRKLGRIARRAFSRERPPGESKSPPVEGPVKQADGVKKTPPPPERKPPEQKANDEAGKKKSKPPKVEEKAVKGGEPPREARPRRTMLTIAGISIALGLLIALVGCIPCISQSGPILFGLFVSSAALGVVYYLTWRGSQVAHTILVVLTLIFLGLGFVMLLAVSAATRASDLGMALAVGGILVGWTGIPLLVTLIRGARMQGAGVRVGAK